MARYYQTAKPEYVDDFVYQPPWKLIEAVGAKKQQDYDNALASANLLRDIQINHLNSEDENYNVKEIQRYYNTKVDNIVNSIKSDGLNSTSYLGQLDSLKKEITQDFMSGNISKIQGSYNNMLKWQEDNKKMKESDPSRYTAGFNSYLSRWNNAGGNSLKSQWSGEQLTPGLDYEALRKSIGELKASSIKSSRTTPAGNLYMVERGGKREELTEQELNGWLLSQVVTPENLASLRQSQQFGLGTYTDEQGNFDWDRGTLFAPLRGMAKAAAYSQTEDELKYSSDGAAIAAMNEAGQNRRWSIDRQDRLNREAQARVDAKDKDKEAKVSALTMAMINAQSEGDTTKFELLEKELHSLTGVTKAAGTQFGAIYDNWTDVLKAARDGDSVAEDVRNKTEKQIRTALGLKPGTASTQFIRELGAAITNGQVNENNLPDYLEKKFPQKLSSSSRLNSEQLKIAVNNLKVQRDKERNPAKRIEINRQISALNNEANKTDLNLDRRASYKALADKYFETANKAWDINKNQDTYMNFAPTSISSSALAAKEINQVIDSDAFSFYDINGTKRKDPVSVKDVSAIDIGNRFGGNSFLVTGEDDKKYIVRGNNNYSPIVNHVSNIVANGIKNKDLSENYQYATNPIAREIKAKINASTTLGSTGGKFNITIPSNSGNKTLDVTYDSSGKVRVFDGPLEMTKSIGPQDPLAVGKALENIYNTK